MTGIIKKFIFERLEIILERDYKRNVNFISRFLNRNNGHEVYLSQDLFEQLKKEENIETKSKRIYLNGIKILNQKHKKIDTDFVINIHKHYQVGYNSRFHGIKQTI